MSDIYYKLPMDEQTDRDLIEWINSLPRNKKAEVVRHALRFYRSHLKEGEVFYYPSHTTAPVQMDSEEKPKRQKVGVNPNAQPSTKRNPDLGALKNLTR